MPPPDGNGITIDQMMQYLMGQANAGVNPNKYVTESQGLGNQKKQMGNMDAIYKMLFDPQFAAATGNFQAAPAAAPYEAPPFQEMWPTLDSYAASPDPTIQAVAAGVKSGQLSQLEAGNMLINDAGQDPAAAASAAAAMFSEYAHNQTARAAYERKGASDAALAASKAEPDMYAKAGFPNPNEQYTQDTIPMEAWQQKNLAAASQKYDVAHSAAMNYQQDNAPDPAATHTAQVQGASDARQAATGEASMPSSFRGVSTEHARDLIRNSDALRNNKDTSEKSSQRTWAAAEIIVKHRKAANQFGVNIDTMPVQELKAAGYTPQEIQSLHTVLNQNVDGGVHVHANQSDQSQITQTADRMDRQSSSGGTSSGRRRSSPSYDSGASHLQAQERMSGVMQTLLTPQWTNRTPYQDAIKQRLMSMLQNGLG